ncbi:hypothetical protein NA56DRAFT_396589 [Hyaloscypha hepaticicola]|uniref:Uncharacterized protein n=1 Tax=Hyaloscypha hepaticicola TaxID=2082293 RepID=A0A2J6PJF0_9HELO|nr:hypothetical protein NA56DRAFT_396589 [Hyaloscypha hepaticicola]
MPLQILKFEQRPSNIHRCTVCTYRPLPESGTLACTQIQGYILPHVRFFGLERRCFVDGRGIPVWDKRQESGLFASIVAAAGGTQQLLSCRGGSHSVYCMPFSVCAFSFQPFTAFLSIFRLIHLPMCVDIPHKVAFLENVIAQIASSPYR